MATKTTMITSPSLKVHTSSNSLGARRFQIPFRSASLSSNKIFSSVIRFRKSSELNRASVKSLSNPPTILSEDVGEVIGEISILRPTGEAVKFKQLWDQEEGVAVVALLRHFGCVCCWELAAALRDSKGRFDSAAVKLIAVGIGSPRNAQIFSGRLPFPWECLYADPDRKAYNALGLYYGIGRTFFNPASVLTLKYFLDSMNYEKQTKTTLLKSPQMIKAVFCNREECLCLKGSNWYMHGRMKGLVIMPLWMMFLRSRWPFRGEAPLIVAPVIVKTRKCLLEIASKILYLVQYCCSSFYFPDFYVT